ncbi:cytoplasmic dynein 2 intermediate chain 1 [Cydia fagiglandana]|uniref:cytoplasmic dynein 2 intermediate chain 1 n=1 Tax=Cydia fagiglandana TaxID=1458189 RepID=UPI002FEE0EDE
MQPAKKPIKKTTSKDKLQEEKLKTQDEKLKKTTYNVSTPRNFVQKTSTADIYKTPKKIAGSSKDYKKSLMKDYLKSSPSSISQISSSSKISTRTSNSTSKVSSRPRINEASNSTSKAKTSNSTISTSNVRARTAKDLPFVNVTVNSPIAKRKLDLNIDNDKPIDKNKSKGDNTKVKVDKDVKDIKTNGKDNGERIRTKTRTLDEDEVKELTPDRIDNNEEMINLKQKLVARPKAFYVGLDEDRDKAPIKSDEEVSYEDDFESYESDFDSYHSENSQESSEHKTEGGREIEVDGDETEGGRETEVGEDAGEREKEKDEENMLDSGSFDLREQRSAKSKPAAMEFIPETEEDKASSLDEGFQDSSSAVSSMRTVEVLERPLFIDFNKSKEKKRKKRIVENMLRRAKDILSMVTLHEMSFTLFEMKPISYDLYMATFGRTNYTQSTVQTFDDGITEEIQTDDIDMENKWTQHPVKFSKADVYLNDHNLKKNKRNSDDYTSKFKFLFEDRGTNDVDAFKEYKENELRILLEQKSGVGSCDMLPYEIYKSKLNDDFNTNALGRFLKKVERKVSHVLNLNGTVSDNVTKSNLPFSSGYVGITTKKVSEEKSFLKQAKITSLIFSEDKSNSILTVHKKVTNGVLAGKSLVCLWDAGVARSEPIKILVAIDDVVLGRFRGNTDGLLVAALEDSSLHLWDLSEQPTWRDDVASSTKDEIVQINTELLTAAEIDREFNKKNINVNEQRPQIHHALQACAYTSSAANLGNEEVIDRTVGLEFLRATQAQDNGRRVVGQVCSLQRLGILIIWTIIQEKSKTHDLGKAFWSKMKLEKTQTISIAKLLSTKDISDNAFNLNAGKKRLLKRKQDKILARNFTRQKSAESDIDRPRSVASARKLPVENKLPHDWESGIVCGDLKIVQYNNSDRFLVAKNNGEVLSCTKSLGAVKIERLCVSTDTSSITCLEVSPHGPYFLAASDAGTISLYSLVEARVLLTLDCRNSSPQELSGPQADFKGRFVDKPQSHRHSAGDINLTSRLSVTSVLWSRINPFCIFFVSQEGLSCWELTHSDIYPKHTGVKSTITCMSSDGTLALVTNEGDVQVHRLSNTKDKAIDYSNLFHKYIALL